MKRTRYYSPHEPEKYLTPSRLKRAGRKTQVDYMVHWFHTYFEDPANETPYNSREGGYQFVLGGPHSARDQIQGEFSDIVPFDTIEEAVSIAESNGIYDWAPSPNHPDQVSNREEYEEDERSNRELDLDQVVHRIDLGVQPDFGGAFERRLRDVVRNEVEAIRRALDGVKPVHGGIGHNAPPEEFNLNMEMNLQVEVAAESVKSELEKDAPNIAVVAQSASVFKRVRAWFAEKADMGVDALVKSLGGSLGIAATGTLLSESIGWEKVFLTLDSAYRAVLGWLDFVTLPF